MRHRRKQRLDAHGGWVGAREESGSKKKDLTFSTNCISK